MDLDVDLDVHLNVETIEKSRTVVKFENLDVHLNIEFIENCGTIVKFEDLDVHLDVISIVHIVRKLAWMCTKTWGKT